MEVCHPNNCNIGLLAYSPLAGGVLSGKYLNNSEASKKSRLNLFPGYMERYNKSIAKVLAFFRMVNNGQINEVKLHEYTRLIFPFFFYVPI